MYYWYIAITHFALAFILFFIVNWLGDHSKPLDMGYVHISLSMQDDTAPMFNYLFKVLAPVIFIVLVSALFSSLKIPSFYYKIYWVVIEYWAIRFLVLLIKGRISLLNWPVQILYWVSSIGLAIAIYSLFDKVTYILPSRESLIEQLWLVIILFLYTIFNKLSLRRKGTEERISRYIRNKYLYFHSKYQSLLNDLDDFSQATVYSIMIYEDFNRPRVARCLESILFRKSHSIHTYGVMQIASDHCLSDEESVLCAKERINSVIRNAVSSSCEYYSTWSVLNEVASNYNPGDPEYPDGVYNVFEVLKDQFYPDINDNIESL